MFYCDYIDASNLAPKIWLSNTGMFYEINMYINYTFAIEVGWVEVTVRYTIASYNAALKYFEVSRFVLII